MPVEFGNDGIELMQTKTTCVNKQLHELEDSLIQIYGLLKALEQVQSDDSAFICLVSVIDEKFEFLQEQFEKHWETLKSNEL